jgi:multidrug efflux pump subunit AcrA (membrane-fusion protein)
MAAAVGVAVIGGGSAAGIAATSSNGPARRMAAVELGSVTQTVESSGTITSSLKLTPSFPTSGTVKSVDVHVGDTVHKGQTLAELDTTALQASVDAANATLASAKQKLEADKTGQTSVGGSSPDATFAAYLVGAPSTSSVADLIKQVEAAQNALIAAQQTVDTGQAAVDTAQQTVDADVAQNVKLRDAQKTACATDTTTTDCGTAMDAYEASAETLSTDMATLDQAISTQDGNVKGLDDSIATLDKLVDQLQQAAQSAGSGSGGGSGSGSGGGQSGGSGSHSGGSSGSSGQPSPSTGSRSGSGSAPSAGGQSGPSGSGQSGTGQSGGGQSGTGQSGTGQSGTGQTSEPASAAQLAADQSQIDAAEAQLKVAQQNLSAATLKSPAAGKVAAVGLSAGSSSSGQTVTIIGTGIPGVSMSVPLAQIDEVKVGQPVSVAADGDSTVLHGTVASIGLLSSTSGSRTTFPVTVRLDSGSRPVFDGSGADATITTGTARNVITVANSAIQSSASGTHTVTVIKNGQPTAVRVTLGMAGNDITQVTSGLKAGQQVVLAELSQPLPGSATSTSTSGTFRLPGGGGFGGGGFGRTGG